MYVSPFVENYYWPCCPYSRKYDGTTLKWSRPSELHEKNGTLTILSLQLSDAGTYGCYVYKITMKTSTVKLEVKCK